MSIPQPNLSHSVSSSSYSAHLNDPNLFEAPRPQLRHSPYLDDYQQIPRKSYDDKIVAVVTGANVGIGFAIAEGLLRRGMHVIMACRNIHRALEASRKLADITGTVPDVMAVDLTSMASVKQFTASLRDRYSHIDILINNAGVAMAEKKLTPEGFETTIQVNFLSPLFLTWTVMDLLKRSREPKVINVTGDLGHSSDLRLDDINFEKRKYVWEKAFTQSKICLAMFTCWLQRYSDAMGLGMKCFSVHPGKVKTTIFRKEHGFTSDAWGLTWKEGAEGVFRAIEDTTLLGGEHLHEGKVGHSPRIVTDNKAQHQLIQRAFTMIGLPWEL